MSDNWWKVNSATESVYVEARTAVGALAKAYKLTRPVVVVAVGYEEAMAYFRHDDFNHTPRGRGRGTIFGERMWLRPEYLRLEQGMNTDTGEIRSICWKKMTKEERETFTQPIDPLNLGERNRKQLAETGRTRVSRNSPCPCGSRKRFKRCCITKAALEKKE